MTDDFATPANDKQFDLGPYRDHWTHYLSLRAAHEQYLKYHERFKELAENYDELVLDGEDVRTNTVSGRFSEKWLKTEHPHIHAAYIKPKVMQVFDEEAFKEHQPTLWMSGRARSLRVPGTKN